MNKKNLISKLVILSASAGLLLGCGYGVREKTMDNGRIEEKLEAKTDSDYKNNKESFSDTILELLSSKNYIAKTKKDSYKEKLDELSDEEKKLVLKIYRNPREFYRNLDEERKEKFEGFVVRKLGSRKAVEIMEKFPWIGRNFEDLDYLMYTPVPGEEVKNERLGNYALGNKLILFYFKGED